MIFAFQVPAAILVVFVFQLGFHRLWQIVALTYVAFALVYVLSYRRGRFLNTVLA